MVVDFNGRVCRPREMPTEDEHIRFMVNWLLNEDNQGKEIPLPFKMNPKLLHRAMFHVNKEKARQREIREQEAMKRDLFQRVPSSAGPDQDRYEAHMHLNVNRDTRTLFWRSDMCEEKPCPDRQENKKEEVIELCLCSKLLW